MGATVFQGAPRPLNHWAGQLDCESESVTTKPPLEGETCAAPAVVTSRVGVGVGVGVGVKSREKLRENVRVSGPAKQHALSIDTWIAGAGSAESEMCQVNAEPIKSPGSAKL